MNDNGGTAVVKVFNAGMRGSKGTAWLGGTHASSFWRWPGTLKPSDCDALTAHIDFYRTIASLAAPRSIEIGETGRRTKPCPVVGESEFAAWADRFLITHQGRWPKGDEPNSLKYKMCSVRSKRWHLVSEQGAAQPKWQLFDLQTDYAETTDVAEKHPDIVSEHAAAFEKFWSEALPLMVNEKAVGPSINPFQAMYYKQFGGSPTPEDLAKMDSSRKFPPMRRKERESRSRNRLMGG